MVTQDIVERALGYIRHQAAKPREELVQIVANGQERFLGIIGGVTDEVASKPPPEGWSLRQLTLHVVAAEQSVANLVSGIGAGRRIEVRDPDRAIGMALPDEGAPYAALVERLRVVNEQMLVAVRGLPSQPDLTITPPHPWFGELSCLEWAAFQRLHDEDHIQHAQKILAAVG